MISIPGLSRSVGSSIYGYMLLTGLSLSPSLLIRLFDIILFESQRVGKGAANGETDFAVLAS